ncbi:hypothetical protein NPIL_101831, partial [Nephila pilipes]
MTNYPVPLLSLFSEKQIIGSYRIQWECHMIDAAGDVVSHLPLPSAFLVYKSVYET